MKNLNTFILCLIFTFSASVQADTADCSGGRCPALDHVKDVGDKIAKDLVPFAVAAIVISVAGTVATEGADGYVYTIDKNAYKSGIQLVDPSQKYVFDVLSLSNYNSYDPLNKNNFSVNLVEFRYKFN